MRGKDKLAQNNNNNKQQSRKRKAHTQQQQVTAAAVCSYEGDDGYKYYIKIPLNPYVRTFFLFYTYPFFLCTHFVTVYIFLIQ
jgi:hypothetical protein